MPRSRRKKIDPEEAWAELRKFVDDEPPAPASQEGKGSKETTEEADNFIRNVAYGEGEI